MAIFPRATGCIPLLLLLAVSALFTIGIALSVDHHYRVLPLHRHRKNPSGSILYSTAGNNEDDESAKNEMKRDIRSLNQWAKTNGVELNGIRLYQDPSSLEWGVQWNDDEERPADDDNNEPIMTIPANLILTSTMLDPDLAARAYQCLEEHGMEQYLPEFCLFVVFLLEHDKGYYSPWYPWISSLPRACNIGIFMTGRERDYVRKLGAGQFLDHQDAQWQAFEASLRHILPQYNHDSDLPKWALSVVFTRSWRAAFRDDQDQPIANLVPWGDMFNHRASATVQVKQDTAQCPVTVHIKSQSATSKEHNHSDDGLYLNYGFCQYPERFLIVFGFCDTSATSICATSILEFFLDIDDDDDAQVIDSMGFQDSSKMVFYCDDGSLSDTLWHAVLYKVLQWNLRIHPDDPQLQQDWNVFRNVCISTEVLDPLTNEHFVSLHQRYRREVVDFVRHEVEDLLVNQFGPIPDSISDDQGHPRLRMLVQYHQYMREVYQKVHQILQLELPG